MVDFEIREEMLSAHKEAAAYLLAAALSDRLGKHIEIQSCYQSEYGYCVEFTSSDALSEEILIPVSERMWEMIRERTPFEKKEMIRSNVRELLKARGQRYAFQGHPKEIIPVLFLSSFVAPEATCDLEHAAEVGAIALIRFEKIEGGFRVGGILAPDSGSIKAAKQAYKEALQIDHRRLGKERNFFEGEIWSPQGVKLLKKLERFISTLYEKAGFQEIRCPEGAEGRYQESVWKQFLADPGFVWGQGLYDAPDSICTCFWSKKPVDLSLLPFPLPLRSSKKSVECPDAYGNFWEIARVSRGGEGSLILSIERLFALLLEHDEIEWLENLEIV